MSLKTKILYLYENSAMHYYSNGFVAIINYCYKRHIFTVLLGLSCFLDCYSALRIILSYSGLTGCIWYALFFIYFNCLYCTSCQWALQSSSNCLKYALQIKNCWWSWSLLLLLLALAIAIQQWLYSSLSIKYNELFICKALTKTLYSISSSIHVFFVIYQNIPIIFHLLCSTN